MIEDDRPLAYFYEINSFSIVKILSELHLEFLKGGGQKIKFSKLQNCFMINLQFSLYLFLFF